MFDRFSDNSRKLMALARAEAVRLRHEAIAPEHVLLGLLLAPDSTAVELLQRLGIDRETLRAALLVVTMPGPATAAPPAPAQLPLTPAVKHVLEQALRAAAEFAHPFVGSQHLLLGLALTTEGTPAQVLARLGATAEALRAAVAASVPTPARGRLRLLLISNSTMHGGGYLEHCAAEIRDFLGAPKKVLFVPYALHDHDAYAERARQAFAAMGHELHSAHTLPQPAAGVERADAVFVGGGNTFRLLAALYHHGLLAAIQQRAFAGMPYVGSSAGTNVATPTIRTTNDMPIVQPPSFAALELVPFQINPHYLDPDPGSRHMGETREERLRQFHEEHKTPVLGLREGCMLRVDGESMELRGTTKARLFRRGRTPEEFTPPCDLSFLLRE